MDQIVVEIPTEIEARVGDSVQVLGGGPSSAAPSISEMADLMNTNSYEVIVGLRARVPRVFIRGGEVVSVRTASESGGDG
jgi:alanine racemase